MAKPTTGRGESVTPERPAAKPQPAALLSWYDAHARRLPWRVGPGERCAGKRPDPYRVWLSEIMLQQTTVAAVGRYFAEFTRRWPALVDLAAADEHDVMKAWAGLGYYARARNLVKCARTVAADYGGRFPETAADLIALPGIGTYTAAAIAAIAFDEPVAVVDGNVERVIARLFAIERPLPQAKPELRRVTTSLVPQQRPGEFAEAMMDLGATICTPKRPACALCPWSAACAARRIGAQEAFPVKATKAEKPTRTGTAYVLRRADGAILLRRRPPHGLLGGMAEVPGSVWTETPWEAEKPPFSAVWRRIATPVRHTFTHFHLELTVLLADVSDVVAPADHWWSAPEVQPFEALPSVMKKVIAAATETG